jgi:phenolic acid decarboxylase
MASEIHQDDVGTRFLITVKDDGSLVNISGVSGGSVHQVSFKKPSDTVVNRNATLQDYGISGVMYYDTVAGDLDEAGLYKLQAKVVVPSGTYYTDVYSFKVHNNI